MSDLPAGLRPGSSDHVIALEARVEALERRIHSETLELTGEMAAAARQAAGAAEHWGLRAGRWLTTRWALWLALAAAYGAGLIHAGRAGLWVCRIYGG